MKVDEHDNLFQIFLGSLFLLNGSLCKVVEVSKGSLHIFDYSTGKTFCLDVKDAELNLSPVNTGYANIQGTSVIISRVPSRQWSVGLTSQTARIESVGSNRSTEVANTVGFDSPFFKEAYCNQYPSKKECMLQISNGSEWVAFHRFFSVNKRKAVIMLGKRIGSMDKNGSISLNKDYKFLEGVLNECQ